MTNGACIAQVHGRLRVDHGAHVPDVRPAAQRRHQPGVRGRAHVPEPLAVLGDRGKVQGECRCLFSMALAGFIRILYQHFVIVGSKVWIMDYTLLNMRCQWWIASTEEAVLHER